jgi:hypothetical protein
LAPGNQAGLKAMNPYYALCITRPLWIRGGVLNTFRLGPACRLDSGQWGQVLCGSLCVMLLPLHKSCDGSGGE